MSLLRPRTPPSVGALMRPLLVTGNVGPALELLDTWGTSVTLENVIALMNASSAVRRVFDVSSRQSPNGRNHDALFSLLTGQGGIPVAPEARAAINELLANLSGDCDANVISLDQPTTVSDRTFWRLMNRLNYELDRVGPGELDLLEAHTEIFQGSDQNLQSLQRLLADVTFASPAARRRFEAWVREIARTVPRSSVFTSVLPALEHLSHAVRMMRAHREEASGVPIS